MLDRIKEDYDVLEKEIKALKEDLLASQLNDYETKRELIKLERKLDDIGREKDFFSKGRGQ